MTTYALERADPELRKMVKEAKAGKAVILTEDGKPVAEVKSTSVPARSRITAADIDAVRAMREKYPPLSESSVEAVRKMRDELP